MYMYISNYIMFMISINLIEMKLIIIHEIIINMHGAWIKSNHGYIKGEGFYIIMAIYEHVTVCYDVSMCFLTHT